MTFGRSHSDDEFDEEVQVSAPLAVAGPAAPPLPPRSKKKKQVSLDKKSRLASENRACLGSKNGTNGSERGDRVQHESGTIDDV